MYIDYAKVIYEELIKNEFYLFTNVNDNSELNSNTIFVPLIKSIGNILYVVFIVNIDKTNLESFDETKVSIKNFCLSNKDSFNFDTVIFTSLYLTMDVNNVLEQNTVTQFVAGLDFYNVNWVIDMKSAGLVIPDGETDKILNLTTIIKSSFNNISNTQNELYNNVINYESYDLHDSQKDIYQKTALKVKSNNSNLTACFILINFIVLILMELLLGRGSYYDEQSLILFGANNYFRVVNQHEFYRLITSMFLHIGFPHLLVNSMSLYIYGSRVEKYYGKAAFIIIYIFSGIAASGVSTFVTRVTSAGASGAIFGLLGSLLAMILKTRKTIDGLNLYIIILLTLSAVGFGLITTGIDNSAHIGGLIAGFIIGWIII